MMYVDFNVGSEEYKLRLSVRSIVALEKSLGCNPIGIFGNGETIPPITQMVAVLHAALQKYHHGITMDKAYDIFEGYLDDGHTMNDFIAVIIDVYRESGIIPKDNEAEEAKN